MELSVSPHANDFAAQVRGVQLSADLSGDLVEQLRALWHRYQVLYFPEQPLTHTQLEAFTRAFGAFGHNPYVRALNDHRHILEIRREPDEEVVPFGSSWHSDWSFQVRPPSATILHAKVVPPIGGGTHFVDGFRALETLPKDLLQQIEGRRSIHSARKSYSREAVQAGGRRTSMTIEPSNDAWQTQLHPIIRTHPDSGRQALWINPVYTIGIEGMPEAESAELLTQLFDHMLQPALIYQHQWAENMLTMWDNRSVLHSAQGGYAGYQRIMHRTTVTGSIPV